ncbi:MAG: biofilm regulation phosphoprotein SiaC [Xylophilus ampelinus]
MHDIHIPGSPSTPDIHGDAAAGVLAIRGDSYPENSFELFSPVIDWVRAFLAADARPLTLDLGLVYLNTSSVKAMMDIFDLLEEAHGRQRPVAVRWTYDPRNGQIAELAEEFREDCTFPFEIVPR